MGDLRKGKLSGDSPHEGGDLLPAQIPPGELALPPAPAGEIPSDLLEATREAVRDHQAEGTRRVYLSHWWSFAEWCKISKLSSLPALPDTLALWVNWLAMEKGGGMETLLEHGCTERLMKVANARPKSWQTILLSLAAIVDKHSSINLESPRKGEALARSLETIARRLRSKATKKAPILGEQLSQLLASFKPDTNEGCMKRALLLTAWGGARRRSEVVAIDKEHLTFVPEGVKILIPKSKTDQEGEGETIAIYYQKNEALCPVRALKAWLARLPWEKGAVFRRVMPDDTISEARLSGRAESEIVKRACKALGLDPKIFGGHSLRAGFVTTGIQHNVPLLAIMRQTGHKSLAMVQRYYREADVLKDNPTRDLLS